MKVQICSTYELAGGASRAANRLHKGLIESSIESEMLVAAKQSDDWRVLGPGTKFEKISAILRRSIDSAPTLFQRTNNTIVHSPGWLGGNYAKILNNSLADVVNLHWICGGFMSVGEIGRIRKPVVWTLHDMWAFSGAEHCGPDDASARWRSGYERNNRDATHGGLDIDRWTWRRKKRAWNQPHHVVAPSRWLADCAKASDLMRSWPVTVIPNVLDMEVFRPWPKLLARQILRLPEKSNLILFGAMGGTAQWIKGWDLLTPALMQVAKAIPDAHCVIFGQSAPQQPPELGLQLHWMGHLHDDATLALLYSAADVMVVPSRQDNLPQSGTEPQACGCPVVAFNVCGLPDVVVHKHTGYLARAYDSEDLARGINWVLSDTQRHQEISANARTRSLSLWSPEVIVKQYVEVYQNAIALNRAQDLA